MYLFTGKTHVMASKESNACLNEDKDKAITLQERM